MLAQGCLALQSELADKALESLDTHEPASISAKAPSELLGLSPEGLRGPGMSIQLPQLDAMSLM